MYSIIFAYDNREIEVPSIRVWRAWACISCAQCSPIGVAIIPPTPSIVNPSITILSFTRSSISVDSIVSVLFFLKPGIFTIVSEI